MKVIATILILLIATIGTTSGNPTRKRSYQETSICSMTTGKLNGLCIAFCNATKCGTIDSDVPPSACSRILENIRPLLEIHNSQTGDGIVIELGKCEIASSPMPISPTPTSQTRVKYICSSKSSTGVEICTSGSFFPDSICPVENVECGSGGKVCQIAECS